MAELEMGLEFDARDVTRIGKYLRGAITKVKAETRKAVAEEARFIMKRSQEYVPVRTGLLKRSKFIRRARTGSGTIGSITIGYEVKEAKKNRKEVYDYAPIVEHGRKGVGPFPGRFYLKRAFESTKSGRSQRIAKSIRRAFRR